MSLRARLNSPGLIVAPGCYDALSALLIERAEFEAAYVSGASIAYTRFGRPDIGLVSVTELADVVAAIGERVSIPLIVDMDTGFGNALNVQRTVKLLAQAGATALQLEDQVTPKRCGHLAGKELVSSDEMCGKIRAAVDARPNDDVLLIARTDAIAVEGFDAALDRAEAYLGAGADVLFIEAPQTAEQLAEIGQRFDGRAPLLANMVEGGKTPLRDATELEALGFSIAIFPGGTVRALAHHLTDYFASLKAHGTTAPFRDRMLDFKGINDIVGTDDMLELGRRYE
ncbi:isocitrate lyase/PEP mutase family protein [Pseudorhodoplanes sp.]|uniref:isocitrate lyase/PEP mutase family protein n=1 Tax=Pseudorhodoplanes sp. TaxID=1934341 RepID=UPI002C7A081B|nr:isocitrate lyase/phosphoenolpyruvate mutase family protein [Pseudorhodoplanes sp.]HWV54237.1 isocitrate lyase/phosphoenolpyruvate mutase family protein [Pseudorhodoplanes sp.]